jgi:UDP-N-acetylmuramoyl-tripeptide--D-alanyl-D-alanine ligase
MSPILWTSDEAAAATKGQISGGAWEAHGTSIDSRSVAHGDLFVALVGPVHDGHDYVRAALEKGAAAALVHRIPEGLPAEAPVLRVDDTLAGLYALAAAARARSAARVVAITGSVGKTSTKEMLKLLLETAGPTHASAGNFNNHWGVPLSLARMPRDVHFAVFEMGMNHKGELAPLTRLVRPHVAVVTAVEAVHMEFFTSTTEIAEAKAEIFLGVESGGTAILPGDNPHFNLLRTAAQASGINEFATFGTQPDATARLLDCAVDPNDTLIFALIAGHPISYRIGVPGMQWATNSMAALLAARAVGVSLPTAVEALSTMHAPKGRGARRRLPWGHGVIEVIDESYNASPVSMRAAIATLAAARLARGARRIAVLGDMLELGDSSPTMHAGLAQSILEHRIDLVFTAGPLMWWLYDALPSGLRGGHSVNADDCAAQVAAMAKAGDVIMVKGSAGSRMGRVVKGLEDAAAQVVPPTAGH